MSTPDGLHDIAIETRSDAGAYPATGNDLPILHEIRHALQRLAQSGEKTVIDLQAIPMAPGEEERILQLLGRGEVSATIDALGPSEVRETAFAGVWTVYHRNTNNEVVGKFIEITHCPDLLHSQPEDIATGMAQIGETLAELESKQSGDQA